MDIAHVNPQKGCVEARILELSELAVYTEEPYNILQSSNLMHFLNPDLDGTWDVGATKA